MPYSFNNDQMNGCRRYLCQYHKECENLKKNTIALMSK